MAGEHTAARWDGIYRAGGGLTNSWYRAQPAFALGLIADLGVPRDAAILDVGGGAGNLVDGLLAAGHQDITVLDLSETALGIARRRVATAGEQVNWVAHDLLSWQAPRSYAVWHDRALLHFQVADVDRARYLAVLRSATALGSHVVLAVFALDGPTSCSGAPVRRYDGPGLAEFLGPDFRPGPVLREIHRTPTGAEQPFTWALFRRE